MKNLILILLIFSAFSVQAQKVTGYWYGQANVEMAGIQNNYLTELIISQKGNRVKGFFGYYFKDVYQSFVVKGTYDPKTRKVVINDIPIIYFKTNSTMNSVDCITSFYGTLRVSKVKTELVGYFYRDKKYTYTCPDLRVNYTLYTEAKVEDSIFKDMSSTRSFWKPQPPVPELVKGNDAKQESEMGAVADASTSIKKSKENAGDGIKPIVKNTDPAEATSTVTEKKSIPDQITVSEKRANPVMVIAQPVVQSDIMKINEDFKRRKQIVSKEIEVASDSIRLSFYDNAEVDGDSISVFFNGKLILTHQELTERAFNVYVQLDSSLEVNEVSMFAENLGKYPPNTALMVISDGDKRYETFLSSDFKGNATIRLKLRRNSVAGN
ncbi:MAG TPA: hypothetical protein VGZ90_02115 [Puia sp.]|jgi:hypothetical protein|nr:hypothetical protein [Puia sp.]